ncbi:MAG: tetratricopeptide repeat family protein [Symbiobacteriaceae bacterium]|jgi:tetratricopeptide (TPR) repeat protein|nr:tetratricopeptide repeat family protein [Symbiobacteriaceae bacterium]
MTIGRNDPCPCGSGKKYKKCCLPGSDVLSLQHFRDKRTSDALLDRLVTFIGSDKLAHEVAVALPRFLGQRVPAQPKPDERSLPMDWMMFHYRSSDLETTLCEHFARTADGLTPGERDLVSGWAQARPGYFRVNTVGSTEVELCRLGDQQTFRVDAGGAVMKTGEWVAASLLPVPSGYRFGVSRFAISKEMIPPLEHLLREELGILRRQQPGATWDDLYRTCWPRLVDDARWAEARGIGLVGIPLRNGRMVQGSPVDDPRWQTVADLLAKEMHQAGAAPERTQGGLRLWWDAVHAIRPRVTKVEAWVGALAYLISGQIYGGQITQDEVAESFGVSATTVGARARQIAAALDLMPGDDRYVDLLDPAVRADWRFDCLTMTKAGTRDFALLRGPALPPTPAPAKPQNSAKPRPAPTYDDDPELDDRNMFRALDLVDRAWEATGTRRVQLARKALALWADAADAYVILGNDALGRKELLEARHLYEEGLRAWERDLANQPPAVHGRVFEGPDESRPYMRARRGLADCLWLLGEQEAAIAHYEDLLQFDPMDSQGNRYVLASHYVEMGDDTRLGKLLTEHAEDGMAAMTYTRALWAYRLNGPGPEADRLLADAVKQNPHVPAFLLGERQIPAEQPDCIGLGDESEAAAYANEFISGWSNTPGALAWLASKTRA